MDKSIRLINIDICLPSVKGLKKNDEHAEHIAKIFIPKTKLEILTDCP